MPKYVYKCPACGYDYSEHRLETQSQIFTKCQGCFNADFVEISQEPI